MIYTTGRLAAAADVGVETVRYYERIGILPEPPRTEGGYRQYRERDLRRLRFIRGAKELGFRLEEIGELLELRTGPDLSCDAAAATADRAIERIDASLAELKTMRRALTRLREACASETATGHCPILDALEEET